MDETQVSQLEALYPTPEKHPVYPVSEWLDTKPEDTSPNAYWDWVQKTMDNEDAEAAAGE